MPNYIRYVPEHGKFATPEIYVDHMALFEGIEFGIVSLTCRQVYCHPEERLYPGSENLTYDQYHERLGHFRGVTPKKLQECLNALVQYHVLNEVRPGVYTLEKDLDMVDLEGMQERYRIKKEGRKRGHNR